ncbi:amino acid ABC transporter permease [Arthrobacter sp. W4I7]|uniref:amino acid ABC transporter permease n=1 Tax=Arthrobacter sp. W4I7 TaxID=3042296 RepID=UPI00277EAD7D|nr:amino acid ABC transporter permease [Arthrobacter sp. W4I7]MDQ0693071.1 polar amino acid transport system permease protein [Arthrobacter sp. W4I7]
MTMSRSTSPVIQPTGKPSIDVADSIPRFRPWRWVLSAVLLVVVIQVALFLVTNPNFGWDVVWEYLFFPTVLNGLGMSVLLAVIAMVAGTLLGVVLATAQLSDFGPARWASRLYIGIFRAVPPLVQLIFWFNLGFLLPNIGIGIPFGPELVSWPTNSVITPLSAAIIGLSLHEGAYMSEIIRSGIASVDQGQRDAAKAAGFTPWQTFSRIIMPQAMRVILPPFGNQFIATLKGTSLVSVIAMTDLLFSVQTIADRTYQVIPMLLVACIWYLVAVSVLTFFQKKLERRYGRGYDALKTPAGKLKFLGLGGGI